MFGGGAEDSVCGKRTERYSFEMVTGHPRQKSHENDVQKVLSEGASRS